MNVLEVENDIVDRLKDQITDADITIRSFPADPTEYIRRRKLSILVRYNGSTYELPAPNRAKEINQIRTASFIITILSNDVDPLTGFQGVYTFLQQVRQALTGYTPGTITGGSVLTALQKALVSMMYPTTDRFVREDSGEWEYEMIFNFTIEETKNQ
jgi:hypothetical protein